jgi:isocitrate dehydrogenase (NAD+)
MVLTANKILSQLQAPIKWESVDVTPILKDGKTAIPDDAIASVRRNYVALKGPLAVCPSSKYPVSHLNCDINSIFFRPPLARVTSP